MSWRCRKGKEERREGQRRMLERTKMGRLPRYALRAYRTFCL